MKTSLRFTLGVAVFLFLVPMSRSASAVSLLVINDNGNTVFDSSLDNNLDFDVDWANILPVTVGVTRQAGDGDIIKYSGTQFNATGLDWTDFHADIQGAADFESVNRIDPGFGDIDNVTVGAKNVTILFAPAPVPNLDALTFGIPGGIDALDWEIDISALGVGDSFQLTLTPSVSAVAIPEPSTLFMLGGGLLGMAGYRWRRRRLSKQAQPKQA